MRGNKNYRDSHQSKNYGKRYKLHYSGDNYNTRVWELEKDILEKTIELYFGDRKINNYLDFACGTGRVCSFLEDKVVNSVGVDVSDSMLEIAKDHCQKTKLLQIDITQDDSINEKFDLITAFRFFLNAEDELRKEALKKMRALLKKDGYLIFNIHGNKNSFRHLQLFLSGRGNEISPNEIRNLLKECGFTIKKIVGVSFLYEKLSFLPKKWWFSLEKIIQKIPFLNETAIDFIAVAQINEKA